jgi:hypothetical protein
MMINLVLVLLFGLAPAIGLTALLIGLPYAAMKRKTRRLTEPSSTGHRPQLSVAGDLQLTTILAEPGEVLLGYRAVDDSRRGLSRPTGVSPSATGTLLLSLGQDAEEVLSILDGWREQGVELALRLSDDCDVVILYDRQTAQRLVFSQPETV